MGGDVAVGLGLGLGLVGGGVLGEGEVSGYDVVVPVSVGAIEEAGVSWRGVSDVSQSAG